jgi:hypothetical protein
MSWDLYHLLRMILKSGGPDVCVVAVDYTMTWRQASPLWMLEIVW